MNVFIQQITDRLIARLPEAEDYYRIQNLNAYDFPFFIIRRIYIELKWNLHESITLPETDWADTDSDAVQASWQQFLAAIHAELRLPAGHVRAVVEAAVTDVAEILVQPRKNIPEILFGGENVLTKEELAQRCEILVVYPHFADVLTTYMERKNRDELSRERWKEIVAKVDKKVTGNYTPLQGAQLLDPLFTLANNSIDTDILRLFFEDKKRLRIARKFDMMDGAINRAQFIEILSSPELLNYQGYEPDQSELFRGDPDSEKDEAEPAAEGVEEQEQATATDIGELQEAEERDTEETETPTEEDVTAHTENAVEEEQEADADMQASTRRLEQEHHEAVPEQEEEPQEDEEEDSPLNAIFGNEDTDQTDAERERVAEEEAADESDEIEVEKEDPESFNEEPPTDTKKQHSPIWQRFMSADEENAQAEDNDGEAEEEYLDEPVIDLTEDGQSSEKKEELAQLLRDEKTYYVDEIFGGSERAYEASLQEIAEKEDWKSASKLIEKNIFKRNMVNIYSEPAVDFTDRLQTYFLNKQHNNK